MYFDEKKRKKKNNIHNEENGLCSKNMKITIFLECNSHYIIQNHHPHFIYIIFRNFPFCNNMATVS